jgi:Protein of unknown function (DUF3095)
MASFARAEFKLELRAAMIPVSEICGFGSDVRVARFAASEHCVYAMFSGGGLTWFEAQAKTGRYALPPASADARPDLSGLSCRWGVAPARNGPFRRWRGRRLHIGGTGAEVENGSRSLTASLMSATGILGHSQIRYPKRVP